MKLIMILWRLEGSQRKGNNWGFTWWTWSKGKGQDVLRSLDVKEGWVLTLPHFLRGEGAEGCGQEAFVFLVLLFIEQTGIFTSGGISLL